MKGHKYNINCQYIEDAKGNPISEYDVNFDISLHEDIFAIMERFKTKEALPNDAVAPFVLGLKLLGQSIMQHKDSPFGAQLMPHFTELMKVIKKG